MKLFTNKADLVAAIEDIRSTGKKLDSMIWVAGVSVLAHIDQHGDISLAQSLVDAMPKGSRVNALIAFMEKFGKVRYDATKKALVFAKTKTTDLEGAQGKSWVEFKPEPPYRAVTIEAMIASNVKLADKRIADNDPRDDINVSRLDDMRAMAAKWEKEDAALLAAKAALEADPLTDAPDTLETA